MAVVRKAAVCLLTSTVTCLNYSKVTVNAVVANYLYRVCSLSLASRSWDGDLSAHEVKDRSRKSTRCVTRRVSAI